MNRHSRSTRALVEAALMIALATILGYFRLYRFPQGGSVDFAMVPILIYCLRWGPAWSLSCCFVNGVLQFFLGGGIALSWQSMLLDYVVAYTLVFLCGFAAGEGSWAGCGAPSWPGWDGGYLSPCPAACCGICICRRNFWDCPWWTPGSTP